MGVWDGVGWELNIVPLCTWLQRNLFEFSTAVSPWHSKRRTTFYSPALIGYCWPPFDQVSCLIPVLAFCPLPMKHERYQAGITQGFALDVVFTKSILR